MCVWARQMYVQQRVRVLEPLGKFLAAFLLLFFKRM